MKNIVLHKYLGQQTTDWKHYSRNIQVRVNLLRWKFESLLNGEQFTNNSYVKHEMGFIQKRGKILYLSISTTYQSEISIDSEYDSVWSRGFTLRWRSEDAQSSPKPLESCQSIETVPQEHLSLIHCVKTDAFNLKFLQNRIQSSE